MPTTSPRIPILRIPSIRGCCLLQVNKRIIGTRKVSLGGPYGCDTGPTTAGKTLVKMKIVSRKPCDQDPDPEGPNAIPNNSVLSAQGQVVHRKDGLALFLGPFTITDPKNVATFKGNMVLLDRIGSHHPPFGQERCNQLLHLEGWLEGTGLGLYKHFTLRAAIVAKGPFPSTGGLRRVAGFFNGVLMKCP